MTPFIVMWLLISPGSGLTSENLTTDLHETRSDCQQMADKMNSYGFPHETCIPVKVERTAHMTEHDEMAVSAGEQKHPCLGLFSTSPNKRSHRHWFANDKLMPTCERCGTEIDKNHKEVGPVCWTPPARLSAIAPGGVDRDWVLVPREPTEEMCDHATLVLVDDAQGGYTALNWSEAADVWRSMLTSAPKAPSASVEDLPSGMEPWGGGDYGSALYKGVVYRMIPYDPSSSASVEAAQAETYRDMHEIATRDLGYPSILEALEATPHSASVEAKLREALSPTFHRIMGTPAEPRPNDLAAYASELEDLVIGAKKRADQWRFIANEMGYEPSAHKHPPLGKWLTDRIAKFRADAALSQSPPSVQGDEA